MTLYTFIRQLRHAPETPGIFNPWYDRDPDNDRVKAAPDIRRRQLRTYFKQRLDSARYLLIAEAVGYQGAHFSGIPMTSERILLGHMTHKHIHPGMAFTDLTPHRTSKEILRPQGFTEPTATIVWGAIHAHQLNPFEVVMWNTFPWHPFDPEGGYLTNRTPTQSELVYGHQALRNFLDLFAGRPVLAVGKKAAAQLEELGLPFHEARHPANGGATKFRAHFAEFINQTP